MNYLSLAEVQVIGLNKENNSKFSIAGYLGCGALVVNHSTGKTVKFLDFIKIP
jgi:hypothetical protein